MAGNCALIVAIVHRRGEHYIGNCDAYAIFHILMNEIRGQIRNVLFFRLFYIRVSLLSKVSFVRWPQDVNCKFLCLFELKAHPCELL